MKSVTTYNMTYIQNTHRIRGFNNVCWFKFTLIDKLTYEINVLNQEKFLTEVAGSIPTQCKHLCALTRLFVLGLGVSM
jgi:hypothetical protein